MLTVSKIGEHLLFEASNSDPTNLRHFDSEGTISFMFFSSSSPPGESVHLDLPYVWQPKKKKNLVNRAEQLAQGIQLFEWWILIVSQVSRALEYPQCFCQGTQESWVIKS